jgi:integrase
MKKKITARVLAKQKPEDKPYQIHDTECRGFIWRCQPTGVQTFYFMYKNADGKRHKILIGRADEVSLPDARTTAEGYRMAVNEGKDPAGEILAQKAILTLKEFIEGPYADWAVSNLKSHKSTLSRLVYGFTALLDRPLDTLTAHDFERNRQARLKSTPKSKGEHGTTSGATVNRDQATLRAALSRAVRWGYMAANPLTGITKSREDRNAAIRPLSADEEQRILGALWARHTDLVLRLAKQAKKANRKPPAVPLYLDYLEPLIVLSVDCGLRRGEALNLLWSDVDLVKGTVTVRGAGAKSSQSRKVPLCPRVLGVLTEWQEQTSASGKVFPAATMDSLRTKWLNLLGDAKVSGVRWHDLRHSFATRLVMAGVALPVVQRLMGHSSITTTARYLHSTDDDARAAVNLLNKGK